jgi:hypothetical protein
MIDGLLVLVLLHLLVLALSLLLLGPAWSVEMLLGHVVGDVVDCSNCLLLEMSRICSASKKWYGMSEKGRV